MSLRPSAARAMARAWASLDEKEEPAVHHRINHADTLTTRADLVITSLSSDEAVEEVYTKLFDGQEVGHCSFALRLYLSFQIGPHHTGTR